MKFLLLLTGLACCGVGFYAERKKTGNIWLSIGISLIVINFSYLLLGPAQAIMVVLLLLLFLMYRGRLDFFDKDFWDIDFSEEQEVGLVFASIIMIAIIFYATYTENQPITLKDNVIEMKGGYGGTFKISEIYSVDTLSVIQTAGMRRKGKSGNPPGVRVGNFELTNENKTAKLRIWLNNPPYIKIRMNDNSLFIFNFKKSDKTVEFYNKLMEQKAP